MSLEFPSIEQALYSELAVIDALCCSIMDNCSNTHYFKYVILRDHLANAASSIRSAHHRMKKIIKQNQEKKNAYDVFP